jgi:hypothetical protein
MGFDFNQWTVRYVTCECGCNKTLQLMGTNEFWHMHWCTNCGSLIMKDIQKQHVTMIRPTGVQIKEGEKGVQNSVTDKT